MVVPELTGDGARHVALSGLTAKPETILLLEFDATEELIALVGAGALLVDDEGGLPEPLLPPQDIKSTQLAISSKLFTQAFMVVTSQCNKKSGSV